MSFIGFKFGNKLAIGLLALTVVVTGCGTDNAPAGQQKKNQATTESVIKVPEEDSDKVVNPLTGKKVMAAALERRPLAIMIENSPAARPQSGLDKADVVYEMLTEGAITRFMGIYYGSDAKEVGPVRSARSYFIERALEYDAIYAHAGGSPEAKVDLKRWKVADLDEFANAKAYYRSKQRKAPHNLYTNTLQLWPYALEDKGFSKEVDIPRIEFLRPEETLEGGQEAEELTINYPSGFSVVDWKYRSSEGEYLRFQGKKAQVEKGSGKQLSARNIILQYVNTKVVDDEGRLEMQMIGSGKGMLFTEGKAYELEWSKKSLRSATEFTFTNGDQIKLNPGQTWIQVVTKKTKVDIKAKQSVSDKK